MFLIRSHRLSARVAVFLAVAMLVAIVPWSARPAAAGVTPPTTVLLFPAADISGGEVVDVPDLPELTTNRLQAALDEVEELAVTEFSPFSPVVRRAVKESRLLPIHMDAGVGDVVGAIEVGHTLGMDTVLLATVKSVDVQMPPRRISVTLEGQHYDVGRNYDELAAQPVADPRPEMSFGVIGTSRDRARYTGSDRPLVREALADAVDKFVRVLCGTPVSQITAENLQVRKSSRWKWLGPLILIGAVALIISNSGGDGGAIPAAATAPRPDQIEMSVNAIRLYWQPPPLTQLDLLRYQIQRSVNNSIWQFIDGGMCGKYSTSFGDFDVAPENTYKYRIRAVYTSGDSSAWVTFDTVVFTGE